MKEKFKLHNFKFSCICLIILWLMLVNCNLFKNSAAIEFSCVDQSGNAVAGAKVLLNSMTETSNKKGNCKFTLKTENIDSLFQINVEKEGYVFPGPYLINLDNVNLKKENQFKYTLDLINNINFEKMMSESLDITFSEIKKDTTEIKSKLVYLEIEDIEEMKSPGESEFTKPKEIKKKKKTRKSKAPPRRARLKIESIPTGSDITIYSRKRKITSGKTPFTTKLNLGKYKIHSNKVNYMSNTQYVELTSSTRYKTITIGHQIIPVKVEILTNPEDAFVYVNSSKVRGGTPLKVTLRKKGTYKIDIKKKGYQDIHKTINLRPGMIQDITINEKLMGKPIHVTFRLPKKGNVYIDGKLINKTSLKRVEIKGITVGQHNIILDYGGGNRKAYKNFMIKHIDGWPYNFEEE